MMWFFISDWWQGFIAGLVVAYLVPYLIYRLNKFGKKPEAEDDKSQNTS